MSILIDRLVEYVHDSECVQNINGKYYIAKWEYWKGSKALVKQVQDAFRVLIGKSRAYHFKEDE